MSVGCRRQTRQQEFWVSTESLPEIPRHVFYEKLNGVLAGGGFDEFVEELCEPHYKEGGRPGIPPGVYFRMLFIGFFECLMSQRAIAWRCADSLSLKRFLGYGLCEQTPDHSSLTRIRQRLPLEVHEQVFAFVLGLVDEHQLLSNKTVAVDSTYLEANAAMKSIVRKETGEDWKEYLRRLMLEAGLIEESDEPSDEDLRRFDKGRKNKKVSNAEWESETDPDSRIARMKDGRTHLAYKAEHVVDLDSEFILEAEVYHANQGDSETLVQSVTQAQANLDRAGVVWEIEEVVADKGYHANRTLVECREWGTFGLRTYIPEAESGYERRWTDKPPEYEEAYRANRRRVQGDRSKRLQKKRSELAERSFAHMCNSGGARRTWLKGLETINKRYLMHAASRNLGLMMRKLFGVGKPRCLQGACWCYCVLPISLGAFWTAPRTPWASRNPFRRKSDPFSIVVQAA